MRIYRSFIGAFCAALACLGFSGLASAHDLRPDIITYAVATVGHYGEASAKAHAELTYMVSVDSVSHGVGEGLVPDGNGFLQARADATVGQGVGNQVALS